MRVTWRRGLPSEERKFLCFVFLVHVAATVMYDCEEKHVGTGVIGKEEDEKELDSEGHSDNW